MQARRGPGIARPAARRRAPFRAELRLRAWQMARAGRSEEALGLQRALVGSWSGRAGPRALADSFRLLRWELQAGCWSESLSTIERVYGCLAQRGMRAGSCAGWIFLARAVAQFQLGSGARCRAALASVLRASRHGRSRALRSAALRTSAAWARLAREPGAVAGACEGRVADSGAETLIGGNGTASEKAEMELIEILRAGSRGRGPGAAWPFTWEKLPELIDGPEVLARWRDAFERPGGLSASGSIAPSRGAEGARPGARLLAFWLEWAEEEPVRRVPVWLVPLLAQLVEDRGPEVEPSVRGRMHRALAGLATQVVEPWARAAALESLAEIALWLIPETAREARSLPEARDVLVRARTDLGLAAGLLHRLGFRARAARCEQRWARLAWPVLGARVAETAESLHPRPVGLAGMIRRCLADAGFLTADPRVLRDLSPLYLLATSPLPVLIQGESGTGKEVVARALHRWSQLRGEFVPIHCGAIPKDLLESELFGHSRGAFTGAALDKIGLVESADHGSLFLDEIGEMGPEAQMKMLRVLESGEVRRLGDLRPRQACIRLIAATHRHLEEAVRDGSFRLDLFHRIRGITVRLRPLRERRGDIVLLAAHYLQQVHRSGPPGRLSETSLAALLAYGWPGNVRELRSVLLRSAHLARALGLSLITPEILGLPVPAEIPEEVALARALTEAATDPPDCELPDRDEVAAAGLDAVLEGVERRLITNALEECGWNRTRAARSLGGLSRTTLISKMKRLGIELAADRARPVPEDGA